MASARFKKLTDLYVKKVRVDLPEGHDIYVRALNTFERDECLDAAQVARSRVVMALREDGRERIKVDARFDEAGPQELREELVDSRVDEKIPEIVNGIRDDPDWAERMIILERTDPVDHPKELSEEETALLEKLNAEFFAELEKRRDDETELQIQLIGDMGDDELKDTYLLAWLEKRGRKEATEEYNLTEMALATEWEDGERVFASKREVRESPKALYDAISQALTTLQMEDRDPKGSGSGRSSSSSSPSPSGAAASDNSGSEATPTPLPGTSPQPSPTR